MSRSLMQGGSLQVAAELALSARGSQNTIVILGDSITANNGGVVGSTSYQSNGFFTWAQFYLGHAFTILKNAGVAGERSDQILARVQSDVIANRPGWCHVLSGTNDIGQGIALATVKANLTATWAALDAAGIRVITGTIPPRATYTGTMLADSHALNQWIRGQGRTRRNLIVVDYYASVASPSGTGWAVTGDVGQNLTPDGVHPGNAGAPRMGRALANTIAPFVPAIPSPFANEGDAFNILPYGRFTQGTVGSATPPTGWNQQDLVGGPIVYSRVPRTDMPGNWLNMVLPAGCRVNIQNPNAAITAGKFAVGDTVVGAIELQRTGIDLAAGASTSGASLTIVAQGPNTISPGDAYWLPASVYDNQAFFDQSGVFRTPPFVIPSGTTALTLQLTLGGGQTVNVDRAGILNLTSVGVAA